MAVINTNTKALFSQNALKITGKLQAKSMEQLSSGKRINTAGDDAAGLAISTRMTQQIRALNQAVRNAGDAISLIQTAEGATAEITNMMQRMRELSIQAINDTNSNPDRSYLDLEFQQLKQEVQRIAEMTEWNGFKVLDGTAGERVGEMPVYKATSVNLEGQVLINPTTARSIAGSDGGEIQTIEFEDDALMVGGTGKITILGQTYEIENTTLDINEFADLVAERIATSALFDGDSGRSVSVDNTDLAKPTLVFRFAATDGDVDPIEVEPNSWGVLSIDDPDPTLRKPLVATTREAATQAEERFSGSAAFIKSGSLTIQVDGVNGEVLAYFTSEDGEVIDMTAAVDTVAGTVTFLRDEGNNRKVFSGEIDGTPDQLVYTLKDASGVALADLSDRVLETTVNVSGSIPALRAGDLKINGIDVGASYAQDDLLSPRNNASGSAIAKAAAINRVAAATGITIGESQSLTFAGVPKPGVIRVAGVDVTITSAEDTSVKATAKIASALRASHLFDSNSGRVVSYASGGSVINIDYPVKDGNVGTVEILPGTTSLMGLVDITQEYTTAAPGTGVYAKVNENVVSGQAMSASSVVNGVVFINGYASANITSVLNNTRETRENVVAAINAISHKTGVKAVDTGFDSKGVTLIAQDGRNIEVVFETGFNNALFGQRLGLREGVQSSTISLESKIPNPVVLTSSTTGDITRAGLIEGNFTKNQSVYNTAPRPVVLPAQAQVSSVRIAGGAVAVGDEYTVTVNGTPITVEVGELLDANDPTTEVLDNFESVRNALVFKVNLLMSRTVTASEGRSTGELLITSDTPGTSFTLSTDTTTTTATVSNSLVTPNVPSQAKALGTDDLVINGIQIRPTTTADDKLSSTIPSSSDRSASAIAIANAINAHRNETGVRALPNGATAKGLVTDTRFPETDPISMYTLYVNGIGVDVEFVQDESGIDRREKVVDAINQRVGQHGVTAKDNGYGISLETDGRNLSVWFDSSIENLSAASFGLDMGDAVAQRSRISVTGTGDTSVVINGQQIFAGGDTTASGAAANLYAAIQQAIADDEANATPRLLANIEVVFDGDRNIDIISTVPGSPFTLTGAGSKDIDADFIALDTASGLFLTTIVPNSEGSNLVTAIPFADATATEAKTAYGTVRLISDAALLPSLPSPVGAPPSDQKDRLLATGKPFTVSVGNKGFLEEGNFDILGFQQGSFGGRSSEAMDPPKVGRLAFQVGASAYQLITIDLADFGKNGSITNEITGDVDLNVEERIARINTRESATNVLRMLDDAMDKINATRAQMGAVMNRLQYAMDNLSNVSMNQEASRSQILDADYAKASTELSKSQIMQQAATAVLAQANMSQQTVLQLLQG
jgi:flagellin